MARRKNLPESVRVKCALSERLRDIRTELFGERGGSEMARRLGLPIRTWYNYEAGVTVPAEVMLRFVELTSVEPTWLLHGKGPRFRGSVPPRSLVPGEGDTVETLLRTALERLERAPSGRTMGEGSSSFSRDGMSTMSEPPRERMRSGVRRSSGATYRDWSEVDRDGRCILASDDSMVPIVAPGAYVAYSDVEETAEELDGELVVVWVDGSAAVRWFERTGRFGLFRAENPGKDSQTHLVELDRIGSEVTARRVLWISTPH